MKKKALNNLFMSYLHGFLSHSLQLVLPVGMSHHKAVTSKVCWSSVDKWNTMSGSGGGWKCLTDSFTLLSTEGNSSDFAHHCVTAAVCTWSWTWYLCHMWLGAQPGTMSCRSGLDDCVDFDAFRLLTWKNLIFYSRTKITSGLPLCLGYSNVFVGIAMLSANDWGFKCWC